MAAAGSHTFHLRRTKKAAVAEMGMAATAIRLNIVTGPRNGASGVVTNPSSGVAVFIPRFTPPGTKIAWLKNGFSPCSRA